MNYAKYAKLLLLVFPLLHSCISEQENPGIDCESSPIVINIDQTISATDCETSDGSFTVVASGGILPYTYETSFESNTDGVFGNLFAGIYQLTVTDSLGCFADTTVSIANQNGVNLDELITSQSGCGTSQGSITILASGGDEPYTFSINGNIPQSDNTFSGLDRGSYNVVVTDDSGCDISQSVEISSGISYETTIKPIIETNCAISNCHNGNVSPDLRTFDIIKSRAERIKARTANRSMPRGRTLTDAQIDQIACWVDDGAPNN